MIELHLTHAEEKQFEDALISNRQRWRVLVNVHNANEKKLHTLSEPETVVLGGSIQVDCTAAVTRSLSLTFTDPRGKLRFEVNSPLRGAIYTNRFISVTHGIWVEDMEEWVDVPTFFGPVTGYSQDGDQVTVEAQGKESLMLEPYLATEGYSIKKNTEITEAVRLVAKKAGEEKFDLDSLTHKIKADKVVRPTDQPWLIIAGGSRDATTGASKGLVGYGDTDRIAFFDGRGKLVVRRLSKNPTWTFDGDSMVTEPGYAFDMLNFRNSVKVTGAEPSGKGKKPLTATKSLPPNHPLSPQSLMRNNKPRFMTDFVNAKSLKKQEDVDKRAEEVLERRAMSGLDVSFDSLIIPHLEEGDRVRVQDDKAVVEFSLLNFSIPLIVGESMSVGLNRKKAMWKSKRGRSFSGTSKS